MSSQCDECGGKCCQGILLPMTSDHSVNRWLELHGKGHTLIGQEFVYIDARCEMLGEDGRCTGYEDRPQVCRDYPGDGPSCRWTRRNVE